MRDENVVANEDEVKPVSPDKVTKKETTDGLEAVLVRWANLPMLVVLLFKAGAGRPPQRLCAMFASIWLISGAGSNFILEVMSSISLHAATAVAKGSILARFDSIIW